MSNQVQLSKQVALNPHAGPKPLEKSHAEIPTPGERSSSPTYEIPEPYKKRGGVKARLQNAISRLNVNLGHAIGNNELRTTEETRERIAVVKTELRAHFRECNKRSKARKKMSKLIAKAQKGHDIFIMSHPEPFITTSAFKKLNK